MSGPPESIAYHTRYKDRAIFGAALSALGLVTMLDLFPDVKDATLVGAVLIAIGAGALFVAARGMTQRAPRLVLDRAGVRYRDWGIEPVPWAAVRLVHVVGGKFRRNVALRLRDPEGFLEGLRDADRARLLKSTLFRPPGDLLILSGVLNVGAAELLDLLRRTLEDAGRT